MATKTINLSVDAYELLRGQKHENESFSEVVRRLVKEKGTPFPREFLGKFKDNPSSLTKEIRKMRVEAEKSSWRRDNVLSR